MFCARFPPLCLENTASACLDLVSASAAGPEYFLTGLGVADGWCCGTMRVMVDGFSFQCIVFVGVVAHRSGCEARLAAGPSYPACLCFADTHLRPKCMEASSHL